MGRQDRVNGALLSSVSSQAGPMVSPFSELLSAPEGPPEEEMGHNAPRQTAAPAFAHK